MLPCVCVLYAIPRNTPAREGERSARKKFTGPSHASAWISAAPGLAPLQLQAIPSHTRGPSREHLKPCPDTLKVKCYQEHMPRSSPLLSHSFPSCQPCPEGAQGALHIVPQPPASSRPLALAHAREHPPGTERDGRVPAPRQSWTSEHTESLQHRQGSCRALVEPGCSHTEHIPSTCPRGLS